MITQELWTLTVAAASIGFFHTVLRPDHYLPFVAMARSGNWSLLKTAWVTALCGAGHIVGSVLLGTIGIVIGVAVAEVEGVESFRGGLAAWALIAFGLLYFVWGLQEALRNRPHTHEHARECPADHLHKHVHTREHRHVHAAGEITHLTPWILFIVFVLGPSKLLIPMLIYPAAKSSVFGLIWVTVIFSGVTIMTMLSIVLVSCLGAARLRLGRFERYSHAISGTVICLCGVAIRFLGL